MRKREFLAHRCPLGVDDETSAEKTRSGIFAEPPAAVIRPRIRSVLFLRACAVRSALLSCAARKASIRTCITGGPRSSWRRARSGWRAIRRVRRRRTRSRTSGLRPASSRRRWPKSCSKTAYLRKVFSGMGRAIHEVLRIREARDHQVGRTIDAVRLPNSGIDRNSAFLRSVGDNSASPS